MLSRAMPPAGFALLALVVALGGCAQENEPVDDRNQPSPAVLPIAPHAKEKFKDLAPADWTLRQVTQASAQYDVELTEAGPQTAAASGAILLDGRFESKLSPLTFSPAVIARDKKEFGDIAEKYPKVAGFETVVDSASLGFNTRRKVERRSVKYVNRDRGVFCRGIDPGRIRCLWGDPQVRMSLRFHSDHTVPALQHISALVKGTR